MGRCAGVFALCLGIVSMVGCGGGSSSTTQQLLIVMASPDAPPVDILIDGKQTVHKRIPLLAVSEPSLARFDHRKGSAGGDYPESGALHG